MRSLGLLWNAVRVGFWKPATRLRSKNSSCIMFYIDKLIGFGYDDSSDTYKVVEVV